MHCVAGVGIRCGILCSIAVGIAVLNCDLDELLLFEVALEHRSPKNLQQQRKFFFIPPPPSGGIFRRAHLECSCTGIGQACGTTAVAAIRWIGACASGSMIALLLLAPSLVWGAVREQLQ